MSFLSNTFTWVDLLGEPRSSGGQLVYETCPVCGATGFHLYINPETGGWFCFAGSHYKGGFIEPRGTSNDALRATCRSIDTPARPDDHNWGPIDIPDPLPLAYSSRDYLLRRGIFTGRDCQTYSLCESGKYPGRVVLPFMVNHEIVYWTARGWDSDRNLKYISAPGRHPLYLTPYTGPGRLVLVEGPFDAIRAHQAGYWGVALCGKTLSRHCIGMLKTILLKNAGMVRVLLDNDALGDAVRLTSFINGMTNFVTRTYMLPEDGDGGSAAGDPGSASIETLREVLG